MFRVENAEPQEWARRGKMPLRSHHNNAESPAYLPQHDFTGISLEILIRISAFTGGLAASHPVYHTISRLIELTR